MNINIYHINYFTLETPHRLPSGTVQHAITAESAGKARYILFHKELTINGYLMPPLSNTLTFRQFLCSYHVSTKKVKNQGTYTCTFNL